MYDDQAERLHSVVVGSNELLIKREDPYGFWHINYKRGVTPEALKGAYTSLSAAEKAIQQYLDTKKK